MHKVRTPAESAQFREAIFRGIAAGKEVKSIAAEVGATHTYVHTVLQRSGYEKAFLSPNEHFTLKQLRAGKGKFVEKK
jgi:hypothetical protein